MCGRRTTDVLSGEAGPPRPTSYGSSCGENSQVPRLIPTVVSCGGSRLPFFAVDFQPCAPCKSAGGGSKDQLPSCFIEKKKMMSREPSAKYVFGCSKPTTPCTAQPKPATSWLLCCVFYAGEKHTLSRLSTSVGFPLPPPPPREPRERVSSKRRQKARQKVFGWRSPV